MAPRHARDAAANLSLSGRARQAWTIARIELRRAFFAKRGLWVYALALLPTVIFLGHAADVTYSRERLSRRIVLLVIASEITALRSRPCWTASAWERPPTT